MTITDRHIENVLSRRSCSLFTDEPIGEHDLHQILSAAAAAHDHGRLQPWTLHVYQSAARQILADAFVRHTKINEGDQRAIDKAASAPFRAPTVVCVATRYQDGKIPRHEQTWSAAAACQLLTLSAHLLGHGATWKTGAWAVSAQVKQALDISLQDDIVGFIYLGRPASVATPTRDTRNVRIIHHA